MGNRESYVRTTGRVLGISAMLGFLVVAVILGRLNTKRFEKRLVTHTQEHLQTIAKAEGQHIEKRLVGACNELKVLAENPRVKEALLNGWTDKDGPVVDGYFPEKLVYRHLGEHFSSLYRLDNKGTVQIRLPWKEGKAGDNYSLKPGVRRVLQDHRPYVSGLFKTDSGLNCISICVPVFEERQFIGVLRSLINLDVIHACLKDSDIGTKGYAWMIDGNGVVISYPETKYVGKDLATALKADFPSCDWSELQDIAKRMTQGEAGTGLYCSISPKDGKLEDTDKLTAFVPLRVMNQRWSLSVVVDDDEVSGPVQDHARNVAAGVALLLLTYLGAGTWFYKVQKDKARLRTEAESAKTLRSANNALNQEIAERKKAEKELYRSEIKSRAALEHSPVCTKIVDLDLNLQYMSRAGIEGLGIDDITDFYGKPYPFDFYPESFRTEMTQNLKRAKEMEEIITQEASVVDTKGNELWFHSTIVPVNDDQGQMDYLVVVSSDTTERKRAEVTLKSAAQAAQSANIAKSRFLANMSHEIRTPMNAILGFSNLLAEADLSQEQTEDINIIRESGKNLLNLIDDILDFSKIEAGQLAVEIIDCSLGRLLNSLESIMKPQALQKSLDFKIIDGDNLPACIKTDPHRLQQCLVNLTNNALKFTDQGHVHMKVSAQEDNGKHFVRFDVEDTGIGVPEDRQEEIFSAFTQADGSTTRKYGGTGLGLTVTKQLVKLLGGVLSLTSEPGRGSVFSLTIPTGVDITGQALLDRHSRSGAEEEESGEIAPLKFSGQVLVVEDVKTNRTLMEMMLAKMGLETATAEDGRQALQKALSQSFDLILMDMQMPRMNGYEATRALKEQGHKTPVVALTANAMKGDEQACMEAGCDGYLSKPVGQKDLVRIAEKWLSPQTVAADDLPCEDASSRKSNCWEFKKCGREPGGSKVSELGVCSAAKETACDGINGGKNAGRYCWRVAGTFCGGKPQGTYAKKLPDCIECDFYKQVQDQHSSAFVS